MTRLASAFPALLLVFVVACGSDDDTPAGTSPGTAVVEATTTTAAGTGTSTVLSTGSTTPTMGGTGVTAPPSGRIPQTGGTVPKSP